MSWGSRRPCPKAPKYLCTQRVHVGIWYILRAGFPYAYFKAQVYPIYLHGPFGVGNIDLNHMANSYSVPYELLSKLLVSPLITPIVVPIPYTTPFKEFRLRRRFLNIRTRKQPNRYTILPLQSMASGRPRLKHPELNLNRKTSGSK